VILTLTTVSLTGKKLKWWGEEPGIGILNITEGFQSDSKMLLLMLPSPIHRVLYTCLSSTNTSAEKFQLKEILLLYRTTTTTLAFSNRTHLSWHQPLPPSLPSSN